MNLARPGYDFKLLWYQYLLSESSLAGVNSYLGNYLKKYLPGAYYDYRDPLPKVIVSWNSDYLGIIKTKTSNNFLEGLFVIEQPHWGPHQIIIGAMP